MTTPAHRTRIADPGSAPPLGIYLSLPFCRSKCSYCNFASGVFPRAQMQAYVERLCADMVAAPELARASGGELPREADSVYLGGGTPTLLEPAQIKEIFAALHANFHLRPGAEITVECAPGTLADSMLAALLECGVNRISLGVQSFVDEEARAVGRLHTAAVAAADVERLRRAGIHSLNLDLIAGLPHQTAESWECSLARALQLAPPHLSVYMLEVDEDSRLGRELLAGGARYHAHFVPQEEPTAQFYAAACERLAEAGILQYEISNFARPQRQSQHNLKYWRRRPYLGLGVDAHSMLPTAAPTLESVRLAMPETLAEFLRAGHRRSITVTGVTRQQAWEETFFLGLRLNCGVDLCGVSAKFGEEWAERGRCIGRELAAGGLADFAGAVLRLTPRGRLLSNEVFERFLLPREAHRAHPAAIASNTIP